MAASRRAAKTRALRNSRGDPDCAVRTFTEPIFRWSDSWRLVLNTAMTIVTVLMVLPIQNTPSRESEALRTELDRLIGAGADAKDGFIGLDGRTDEEIEVKREKVVEGHGVPLPGAGRGISLLSG